MHGDLILAIDPGSRQLGAAVFKRRQFMDARQFKSSKKDRLERSLEIMRQLAEWADYWCHQDIAVGWWDLCYEDPGYFTPREAGQSRPIQALERQVGMLEYWGLSQGMRVFGYNVATVKTGVVGRASATKKEVEIIMQNEYNLRDWTRPSEVWDALAVGCYHLSQLRVQNARLREGVS